MSRSAGKVIFVYTNGGVLVVQSYQGFSVIELRRPETDFPRNAEVSGNWSATGEETLFLGRRKFSASFQGCFGCMEEAVETARKIGGG